MRIYKYELLSEKEQSFLLPEGSKLLTVQVQYGKPHIWALVNPDAPLCTKRIKIYSTGFDNIDDSVLKEFEYFGTFQLHDGNLVFHVFVEKGI